MSSESGKLRGSLWTDVGPGGVESLGGGRLHSGIVGVHTLVVLVDPDDWVMAAGGASGDDADALAAVDRHVPLAVTRSRTSCSSSPGSSSVRWWTGRTSPQEPTSLTRSVDDSWSQSAAWTSSHGIRIVSSSPRAPVPRVRSR